MKINKDKLIKEFCNEPNNITIATLENFIEFNASVVYNSSLLYRKYKDKRFLNLVKSARKNKEKLENLNITDIEEISRCCYQSRRLYIIFKILKGELENNEINIL